MTRPQLPNNIKIAPTSVNKLTAAVPMHNFSKGATALAQSKMTSRNS
jgi:hypothetical protein